MDLLNAIHQRWKMKPTKKKKKHVRGEQSKEQKIGGKSIELRCIYLMLGRELINSAQMVIYRRIKKCRSNNKFHIVAISDTHTHTHLCLVHIEYQRSIYFCLR
jgi:hypothetical protein